MDTQEADFLQRLIWCWIDHIYYILIHSTDLLSEKLT